MQITDCTYMYIDMWDYMGIKVSRITREVNLEANKLRSKRGKIQYQQISNKCCQIDILAPTGAEMHLIFYYKGIRCFMQEIHLHWSVMDEGKT